MLEWLRRGRGGRRKSTNPLATAESLGEILDELPRATPAKALQDLAEWLVLTGQPDLEPAERLTAIRTLDAEAAKFTGEVMIDYIASVPTNHATEQVMEGCWRWAVMNPLHSKMAAPRKLAGPPKPRLRRKR